jgi:glycosyltransferase involved in cell wall biosynthesis
VEHFDISAMAAGPIWSQFRWAVQLNPLSRTAAPEPVTCHISTDLDIGGAEMMLKRMLQIQAEHRANIVVISLMGPGKIGAQLQQLGFQVYALNMQGKWAFPVALFRLIRLLRVIRPGLVQTWMYHADLLGGLAAYFSGTRHIIWGIHCTKVPIGRPLTRWVMQCCAWLSHYIPDRIICVAEAARQNHLSYGYCAEKMLVIPNGFNIDTPVRAIGQLRPILHQLGVQRDEFVVGCVGRFHPDKGQDLLVAAAARCLQHKTVRFVLAGRGCDQFNRELIDLLAQFGIRDSVLLLGERDDIPALLTEFDMFCMPSRSEAFPVALGEAMLAGLPCVATQVGDCVELGGDCVTFVSPENIDEMADGILRHIEMDTAELHQRGEAGRQRVIERFSISAVSAGYLAIYRDVSGF